VSAPAGSRGVLTPGARAAGRTEQFRPYTHPVSKEAPEAPGRTRPSIREAQKASTFEVLLRAAEELFVERGYAATTIEQIASRAGASRATFYLHFEGKWQAAAALAERRLMPETIEYYKRLDALGIPDRTQLRAWLDDALGFYERHRQEVITYRQAVGVEPQLAALQPESLGRCADAMSGYLERWGEERRDEARLRLGLLIIQLTHFVTDWLSGYWTADRQVVLDVLLDLWTAGLGLHHVPLPPSHDHG
jgi:AcrR family transcriptional regulator